MNFISKIFRSVLFVLPVSITIASTITSTVASATQADSLSAQVDSLFVRMDYPQSPGAAVLVIRDGAILHRKGYGSANLEHQVAITPESVFDIASVSKQFAGMAISLLIERGLVNLDDDIRAYIPELSDFGRTITIRHLIHHTSGIRDWPGTLAIAGWQMDDVISFEQILTMAYHQRALNFEPGEQYLYSNTGYNLLAELVSRVTGKTFREWTHENLFVPLGMNDTRFQDDYSELTPHKVYGYGYYDGGFKAVPDGLTALGSSSLFTTVDDLAKWATNFDDHAVGGTAVIERMQTQGVLNNGDTIDYAYGLVVGKYRGQRTISHGGSWAGFRATLLHFPEQHFSVIVLSNFASFNPSRSAHQIADIYIADVLTATDEPTEAQDDDKHSSEDSVLVDAAILDTYVGTYKLGPGWFIDITRDGDHLMVQATREPQFPMIARSQQEFYVPAYNAGITFRRNPDGQVTHFDYGDIKAERVESWNPTVEDLRAFEGQYYSKELATSYWVELRGEVLIAKHRRHQAIELQPLARNEFAGNAWFASRVDFVRDDMGGIVAMLISNGRSFNNEFARVEN